MLVKPAVSKRPRVEMVPLIDMFFLLLVFFIFSVFSMTMQEGILVDLPAAKTSTVTKDEATVTLSISADGEVLLNRRPVDLETLLPALRQARAQHPREPLVVINAHRQVAHGTVIAVLDRVRQAGLQRVSFQTVPADDQ